MATNLGNTAADDGTIATGDIIDDIIGWKRKGMRGCYSSGTSLPVMAKYLYLVNYQPH